MFLTFFTELRAAKLPVSITEYLTLMEAMERGVAAAVVDDFYVLARSCLVKDERNLDRFDRVFAHVFKGLASPDDGVAAAIPEEWLRSLAALHLSDEEKRRIEAVGGLDKVLEELAKRLAEQRGRHQGGSKWIGTGGTSPYGADGYNPAGVRIGQSGNRNFRAIKVWDRREFQDLADDVELGTRSMKVALRRLRRFAREGAVEELDLGGTIDASARRGYLDVRLRPQRRNAIKVLMLFDVGGSMDWHVKSAAELFSAARSEFKRLDYYYFHNCPYESLWKDNSRRRVDRTPTLAVLRTFAADTKLIIVGDAAMSPTEITQPGGSVEHMNEEPGMLWLQRIGAAFEHAVWLNPVAADHWQWTHSTELVRRLMDGRMYPLTLAGLDAAMQELMR